jgi:hypothetical protein
VAEKIFLIQMFGPKQLQISWKLGYRDVKVKVGEELIGIIEHRKDLVKGKTFTLPDGSSLKLFLDQSLSSAGLAVFHNGKPLRGSSADPVTRYEAAFGSLYVTGAVNVVGGILAYFMKIDTISRFGFSWLSIISGVLLFGLGFLVRKGSLAALISGLVLYFLDGVGVSVIDLHLYKNPNLLSIFIHIIFMVLLFQGISAMKQIKGSNNPIKDQ